MEAQRHHYITEFNEGAAMSDTVTISKKEYDELIEDQTQLRHLEANGVDNWDNYSHYTWDQDSDEDE